MAAVNVYLVDADNPSFFNRERFQVRDTTEVGTVTVTQVEKIQYTMRATDTSVPDTVIWPVLDAPDLTGADSGRNPPDLIDIGVIKVEFVYEAP